jgi:hypothetical protein
MTGWLVLAWALQSPEDKAADDLIRAAKSFVDRLESAGAASPDPEIRDRLQAVETKVRSSRRLTREALDTITLSIRVETTSFRKLLELVAREAAVRIDLDLPEESDLEVSDIEMEGVSVEAVLNDICSRLGLSWTISGDDRVTVRRAEVKVYDTRDLVARIEHEPFGLSDLLGQDVKWDRKESEPPGLSADDVVTLITENVDPAVWEKSDHFHITMTPNSQLVISAPEQTHQKIGVYLKELALLCQRQTRSTIYVISAKRVALEGLPAAKGALAQEGFDRILAAAHKGGDVSLVGTFEICGFSGQRQRAESGSRRTIVTGYDPKTSSPLLTSISEGVRMSVQATLSQDASSMAVETHVQFNRLLEIEKISTAQGEVQVPRAATTLFRSIQEVPCRVPVVLGTIGGEPADTTILLIGYFSPRK